MSLKRSPPKNKRGWRGLFLGALFLSVFFARTALADTCDTTAQSCNATKYTVSCAGSPNIIATQVSDCPTSPNPPATTDTASTTPSAPSAPPPPPITPNLEIPIPNLTFTPALQTGGLITTSWVAQYIQAVYQYLLVIGVIIAIVLMMVGGLQYVLSAGGGSTLEATTRIKNAATGLVLLFSVFLVLNVVGGSELVNLPDLSIQGIPTIPDAAQVDFSSPNGGSCTGSNLYGQSNYQDCMLNTYGTSASAIQLQTVTFDGFSFQVNKAIAAKLQAANAAFLASNVSYAITDQASGGFNWRCNTSAPTVLSDHAFGTAIDINPSLNPYCPGACADPTKVCKCVGGSNCAQLCQAYAQAGIDTNLPPALISALTSNGFVWLGVPSKTGLTDYMHFQYNNGCSN